MRLKTLSDLAAATFSKARIKSALSDKLGYKSFNVNSVRHQTSSSVAAEPFLNGSSSIYIEEMYRAWEQDPNSVHKVTLYFAYLHKLYRISIRFCTSKHTGVRIVLQLVHIRMKLMLTTNTDYFYLHFVNTLIS